MRYAVAFSAVVAAAAMVMGVCRPIDNMKQRETNGNIQMAWVTVEKDIGSAGAEPSLDRVKSLLRDRDLDRDAWGREWIVVRNADGKLPRFLIISAGADGRLDVPRAEDYFSTHVSDIHGEPDRDVVIRDGEMVTLAGN